MNVIFDFLIFATAWVVIALHSEVYCKEKCYYINLLSSNWTDDRPRFVVNMTFSSQNGIGSITTINDPIASPVARLLIVQQSPNESKRIVYNMTTKLCAIKGIIDAVPLFKPVKDNMLKQSNYTFSCPLKKGVYVMNNMRINPKNPLLSVLYQAKGTFTVMGALLEELPNTQMHPLSTYNIEGKILKKSCGRLE
ncbi:PREDICTED: uncharacterized protein LOC108609428 [Drosophila arizonae]|uniref:Uncharacterized protein LOC108609428 n=1 Tax=Drosophila arizonae TaxID=7263 RepID=A0ABM1NNV2_DROAR|nr:PREDICTED: uncharacterized protein LOC108609428 [Drosophila arizonae]